MHHGDPFDHLHPEYVRCMGKRFLSSWGEEDLRMRLNLLERALLDIERSSGEDASLVARRAMDEVDRRRRF